MNMRLKENFNKLDDVNIIYKYLYMDPKNKITFNNGVANLTIRIDNSDKQEFARICEKIGLTVSTAFNVFVKSVIREEKIPFELSAKDKDDFYNEANIRHLEELKRLDDEGKLKFITKTMDELREMEK